MFLCAVTLSYAQQAGDLDSSFGTNGTVTSALPLSLIAVQKDGKIVAAGSVTIGNSRDFLIVRYNSDGTLDNTFDGDGTQSTNFSSANSVGSDDVIRSIALQDDGKIVAVGTTTVGADTYFAIARYNSNGSLDNSFSGDGKQTTDFGFRNHPTRGAPFDNETDAAASVAMQADGKIVVAGNAKTSYSSLGSNPDFKSSLYQFAIARYNADGSLDNTFDGDGKQITLFGSDKSSAGASAVAINSDGKIVVAGISVELKDEPDNVPDGFAVARYNNDGSLDNSFDTDGKVTTEIIIGTRSYKEGLSSLAIQADGKIVVAGTAYYEDIDREEFALARYNVNGSLDNTFGGDGIVITDFTANSNGSSSLDAAHALVIQADGKIIAAGVSYNGDVGSTGFALARYNSDGSLDNTFSGDGKQITNIGGLPKIAVSGNKLYTISFSTFGDSGTSVLARYLLGTINQPSNQAGRLDSSFSMNGIVTTVIGSPAIFTKYNGIAVQADGKTVAAGSAWNGTNYDFAVARYNKDGTLDKSFGTYGKRLTDFDSKNDYANSVAIQSDGKIVVVGYSNYNGNSHISIARYNTDGSPDNSFSTDGKVITDFNGYSQANSVAIQSDGKIVVAGISLDFTVVRSVDFTVVRYNTDGSLDNTFSEDGKQVAIFYGGDVGPTNTSEATSIAILSNGKIVVGGNYIEEGSFSVLICYNTDGSMNWQINGLGFSLNDDTKCLIAVQKDDKIIVAKQFVSYFIILHRVNPDGSLDNSFSEDGVQVYKNTGSVDTINSIALQNNGKIILAGSAIFRFTADGNLDNTFGDNGIQRNVTGFINDIAIDGNKLYGAGYVLQSGITKGVVSRYILDNNVPPTVKLTSPVDGGTYSTSKSVELSANDGTLKMLQFYNGNNLIGTELNAPYYRKWYNVPAGNYTITAKATDNNGGVTISAPVHIHVIVDQPPVVNITSPVNGASYTAPATFLLSATATDVNGTIKMVEFYNGTTLLRTEKYSRYEWMWKDVAPGTYTITAKATDNLGVTTTSAPVKVTITSPNNLMVSSRSSLTGKVDLNTSLSLALSPNPARDILNVSVNGLQQNKPTILSIISSSGVVIKTIQTSGSNQTIPLNVSLLASGVYTVKIVNGDKVINKQFVKL